MSGSGVLSSQKQNKLKKIVQRLRKSGSVRSSDSGLGHRFENEKTFAVFVGKEQRRYDLGEHYLRIPLFRSLMERFESKSSPEQATLIPCEVVMFDHLLWMLDSGNPAPESVDELLEFYAY